MSLETMMADPHAPYVLGSYLLTALLIVIELVMVLRRKVQSRVLLTRARQAMGEQQ